MGTINSLAALDLAYMDARNNLEAKKFTRQAASLVSVEGSPATATIVHCPDCGGLRYHEHQCDCHPNPAGCWQCGGKGWTAIVCNTCKGEGEVLINRDGTVEPLK